jgi:hypothetical protein
MELVITNIPYQQDENLDKIVQAIAKVKSVTLPEGEVQYFRALSKTLKTTNEDRPPKIIIKFTNPDLKSSFKKRRGVLLNTDIIEYEFKTKKQEHLHQ